MSNSQKVVTKVLHASEILRFINSVSVGMCTSIVTLRKSNDENIVVQDSTKLLGFVFVECMKLH